MGDEIRMWWDTWAGNEPLYKIFPDLYKIEKKKRIMLKDCFCKENGDMKWKWRWKKQRLNQKEKEELKNLEELLQQVNISGETDQWIWKPDDKGIFSVASMKSLLVKSSKIPKSFSWKWNGWVPKKVNTFMWKAVNNNIPTMLALKGRQFISEWCNISSLFAFSTKDLINIHSQVKVSKNKRKGIQAVIFTAAWCIWNPRNEAVFQNKVIGVNKMKENIKALGYLWVKNRFPCSNLEWKE
ncbi:uncharacterized protein LOC110913825 [Helianthus annuus]|uniref:uncharacterized protein LOC110913825 n=1 Tax=Helianthus annuus TaxID=4232 RepID=UPI000B905072|nr:uncharacterized protein LOC110913825 [Helianthus annuus]